MIIDKVNVSHIAAVKSKDYPPVSGHTNGPLPREIPSQRVEPVAGQIHIARPTGHIQPGEDAFDPVNEFGRDAAAVSLVVQSCHSTMSETEDHTLCVTYHLSGVNTSRQVQIQPTSRLLDIAATSTLSMGNLTTERLGVTVILYFTPLLSLFLLLLFGQVQNVNLPLLFMGAAIIIMANVFVFVQKRSDA